MIVKIITDLCSFVFTIIVSILLYNIEFIESIKQINWILIIASGFLFFLSIYNYGGYKKYIEFSQLNEIMALIKAAFITISISIIMLFLLNIEVPEFISIRSRIVFVISLIIIPSLFRQITSYLFPDNNPDKEKILLIGAGVIGKSFMEQLSHVKSNRFKIHGILDDKIKKGAIISGKKIIGCTSDLISIITNSKIDRVIVAVRHISQDKLNKIRSDLLDTPTKLYLLPSIESFITNPAKLSGYSGLPIISKNDNSQSLYYLVSKRCIDIIGSIVLFVITIPLWLIIMILVYLDSKGNIFFNQYRVGLNGEHFQIYKFRTMFSNVEKYDHCPIDNNDNRVTKIGKWLRKTSLDELPQLLNIFKGEMSLVGPRPEMPFQVEGYTSLEKRRWSVKPGLTGLWQITPHRNAEPCENPEFDHFYISNQSITLDLVIIFMTGFFVLRTWTN